jgi:hypothetical protein
MVERNQSVSEHLTERERTSSVATVATRIQMSGESTLAHATSIFPGCRLHAGGGVNSARAVAAALRPEQERRHRQRGLLLSLAKRRCTASRRPPRSSATLSPIGLAQESYWPAASALTGGPWSPASWKIAGTSGSAMNFS